MGMFKVGQYTSAAIYPLFVSHEKRLIIQVFKMWMN